MKLTKAESESKEEDVTIKEEASRVLSSKGVSAVASSLSQELIMLESRTKESSKLGQSSLNNRLHGGGINSSTVGKGRDMYMTVSIVAECLACSLTKAT